MDIVRGDDEVIIMVFNPFIEFFNPGPRVVILSFLPECGIKPSRGGDGPDSPVRLVRIDYPDGKRGEYLGSRRAGNTCGLIFCCSNKCRFIGVYRVTEFPGTGMA